MLKMEIKKVLLSQLIFIKKTQTLKFSYIQNMKINTMLEEMMPLLMEF